MASEIWYLVNPASGTNTVSVTVTGATDAIKLAASTFTNVVQSSPVDVSNTATGSTGNPSVSATTTTANDLVIATLSRFSTTAATSNRTSLYNNATGSILGASSYQIQTSAGSSSDTYTGSTNNDWSMVMAAFKPYTTSPTTTVKYIHTDHLTGSSVVSDSSGAQVELLDYFPYGNTRIDSGSYNEQRKYTGSEYDVDTGLNYMNARYYNSAIGRFISQDPMFWGFDESWLEDPQLQNAYSYARNNPLRYNDPTGESPKEVRTALFAARHPSIARQIGEYKEGSGNISTVASDFAINSKFSYNTPGQLGSQRNAFRHVLWQAMITKQFGSKIAVSVGDAHEDNPHTDLSVRNFSGKNAWEQADQAADLLNNEIGRSIGEQYKNESNTQLAVRTLDYYYNIGVYVAEGDNNGNVKVYQHQISLQEYNMGYDYVKDLNDSGHKKDN